MRTHRHQMARRETLRLAAEHGVTVQRMGPRDLPVILIAERSSALHKDWARALRWIQYRTPATVQA